MSNTTFSPRHLVPDGRAMLACSCLIPDGWVDLPVPDETYDFDNPAVFLPLLVCMAPFGAVVFTVAARPAYDDGSVQDWAEYLAAQQQMSIERVRQARVGPLPCILLDATMASEVGLMRSRSLFIEDGRRLFNVGALAPDAIWSSVEADFSRLLGSFTLDESHGITAAPLREMTSEPPVLLSSSDITAADEDAIASGHTAISPAREDTPAPADEEPAPDLRAARSADVALADDAASLDPDHPINANLRDHGVGLVPRVLGVSAKDKYATIGAAALVATFNLPFGWHVIDDGRRTLVFNPESSIQINLSLRSAEPDGYATLLARIQDDLASENPQAKFLTLEVLELPCLAVRDLLINGEDLDQAYLLLAVEQQGLVCVCRVTADRANMTKAMDTAEVILRSLQQPPAQDTTSVNDEVSAT